jgi:DNA polymerase-1
VTDDKKLFLLDAYALIYRAYYALIRAPRVTSDGRNTSAIFGFCNTLDDILKKENPPYIAVCFDPPGGQTFRHEVYEEYKAGREKQPEDITFAVPYIKDIIRAYGIQVIEMPRFEADDIIGTLSVRATADGFTTYMMTPDKDYGQLVNDHVFMYRPALKGQGFEVRGPKEVCEKYNIEKPVQVIDILALEGDASDNIPGCPGVGEKGAAKLVREFGSVENMLDQAETIKGAVGERIRTNAEQIRFSKFLATIKTDVPVDVEPEALKRGEVDVARLVEIFNQLEFKSLIVKLKTREGVADTPAVSPAPAARAAESDGMGSLFDDIPAAETKEVDLETFKGETTVVRDIQQLDELVAKALQHKTVGTYVHAEGDESMTAILRGIAVSTPSANFYVSFDGVDDAALLQSLSRLYTAQDLTIASHDVKRDSIILRRHGIEVGARTYDTAIAHYLLNPEMRHDIADVAMTLLSERLPDYEMTAAQRKKYMSMPMPQVAVAAAMRAQVVRRLVPTLTQLLESEQLKALFDDIEMPLVPVLAAMEWEGVRIDSSVLAEMSRDMTRRVTELEEKVYEIAGARFNIGSPSQVGDILFGQMQIDPKAKRTKTGQWSTTEEILEKHRAQWPIVDYILQIRGLKKLLATYIDALPKLVNPVTGKIHTTFNQTVTATGRISSTNPNLQNIPIRTDEGREIRRAFVPDAGHLMMSADYSQIELRLMAHMSGDEAMIGDFNSDRDIHRATAAKIYHLPIDKVTDQERRAAKTANFGIIYGISAFGLSERLGISRGEAKNLIESYLATYPGVSKYMDDAIERARTDGYVSTVMGRKRRLADINSRNAVVRGYAERNAINAPLQGSAADIIKRAMIDIDAEIRRRGLASRMILQVHDELLFDVAPGEVDELQALVIARMEGAFDARVPLTVSSGVAANWLEAH